MPIRYFLPARTSSDVFNVPKYIIMGDDPKNSINTNSPFNPRADNQGSDLFWGK